MIASPLRSAVFAAIVLWCLPLPGSDESGQFEPPTRYEGFLEINDDYFQLSAATGGDFYFWAPGEFARTRLQIFPIGAEPIALAYGDLPGQPREVMFPVDGTVKRMTLFAGIQRKSGFELVDPDGGFVTGGSNVVLQETQHMVLAQVDHPKPGEWTLRLSGEGRCAVAVRGASLPEQPLELISIVAADFVEKGGRPGHEGLFARDSSPPAGSLATTRLELSGQVEVERISLVKPSGETLEALQEWELLQPDEVLAFFTMPDAEFRIAVEGRASDGSRFRRVTAAELAPGHEPPPDETSPLEYETSK